MELQSLIISLMAIGVSAVSFYFSVNSWRESNRPLITVRVTSFGKGGNVSVPLSLLVENTGNRPAKKISLKVKDEVLDEAILSSEECDPMIEAIKLCFSERGVIPVLANGKSVHSGFGMLKGKSEGTWKPDIRLNITIDYEDLDGRRFSHVNPLLVAEDSGFAGFFWNFKNKT